MRRFLERHRGESAARHRPLPPFQGRADEENQAIGEAVLDATRNDVVAELLGPGLDPPFPPPRAEVRDNCRSFIRTFSFETRQVGTMIGFGGTDSEVGTTARSRRASTRPRSRGSRCADRTRTGTDMDGDDFDDPARRGAPAVRARLDFCALLQGRGSIQPCPDHTVRAAAVRRMQATSTGATMEGDGLCSLFHQSQASGEFFLQRGPRFRKPCRRPAGINMFS